MKNAAAATVVAILVGLSTAGPCRADEIEEKLSSLQSLKSKGLITEADYDAAKRTLLEKLTSSTATAGSGGSKAIDPVQAKRGDITEELHAMLNNWERGKWYTIEAGVTDVVVTVSDYHSRSYEPSPYTTKERRYHQQGDFGPHQLVRWPAPGTLHVLPLEKVRSIIGIAHYGFAIQGICHRRLVRTTNEIPQSTEFRFRRLPSRFDYREGLDRFRSLLKKLFATYEGDVTAGTQDPD